MKNIFMAASVLCVVGVGYVLGTQFGKSASSDASAAPTTFRGVITQVTETAVTVDRYAEEQQDEVSREERRAQMEQMSEADRAAAREERMNASKDTQRSIIATEVIALSDALVIEQTNFGAVRGDSADASQAIALSATDLSAGQEVLVTIDATGTATHLAVMPQR